MLRKISLMAIVSLSLAFMVACVPAGDTTSVVVIDSSKIFRESTVGKNAIAFIEGIQTTMQDEINKLQAEFQKNPEDAHMQQLLQTVYMQFQQRMSAEQQNVANLLNDVLQATLDEYRTSKKIKVILASENLLSFDKTIDVSDDIIKALDTKTLTLKEISTETPAEMVKLIIESMPAPEAEAPEGDDAAAPAEEKPAQ